MKLPIKRKYFDEIKNGKKNVEYRDAHITFICEETGETIRKEVINCYVSKIVKDKFPDVLEDDNTIVFQLKTKREK